MKYLRKPEPPKKKPAKRPAKEPDAADVQAATIKVTLANTPLRANQLVKKLQAAQLAVGFDTEVAGPLLRGRDFVNISYAPLLGLSVAFGDEKCFYVPVRHKGNNISFSDLDKICGELQRTAQEGRLWAHNAKFDHQAMMRAGYPLPGLLDSMIAAWLVTGKNKGIGLKQLAEEILDRKSPEYDPSIAHKAGDQVKLYAGHDALNTLQLGAHFRANMSDNLYLWFIQECQFTHILAEMKLRGMRVDVPGLLKMRDLAAVERAFIVKEWSARASDLKISSSKQLQALFEEGIWKTRGRTAGGAYSTATKAMEYNAEHGEGDGKALAQLRLDYQEVDKIVGTYSDGLIEEARQWADGKLHPDLYHFGTVTGRLSSANPNIQNQPAHSKWAKIIRECFVPDPGTEFTSADYSQVELRYFAEYCGGGLLATFMGGGDVHDRTAAAMAIDRDKAKTVNFGFLLYGGAPEKLAKDVLGCTKHEAEDKIAQLHREYPEVERWRTKCVAEADASSAGCPFVHTLAGRIRHIPELNPDWMRHHQPEEYARLVKKYHDNCRIYGRAPKPKGPWFSVRSRGERLVVNYLIQGGARDLLVLGMNAYREAAPPGFTIVTTVHDEVLTQHPAGRGEEARKLLQEALESAGPALGLKVPILAEPKTGSTWGEVK